LPEAGSTPRHADRDAAPDPLDEDLAGRMHPAAAPTSPDQLQAGPVMIMG
jgi:hypothetical protein